MSSAVITLTTDFGLTDHYVGVIKGVISTIAPNTTVVDVCHELPLYGVSEAAFTVAQSYRYFPAGTIHLVVVDPEVGSSRKILLVEVADHRFVAPDNGVLSQVFEGAVHPKVWTVDTHCFALEPVSQTFHGRDIFAPIAAHAANGKPSSEFGVPFAHSVRLPPTSPKEIRSRHWRGVILAVDHFGNIVTSFPISMLPTGGESFLLRARKVEVISSVRTYHQGSKDKTFCIAGSSGYIEISLREGSAAARHEIAVGDSVELSLSPQPE